ncbi:hypothetical protein BX666DRAFT_1978573 [Dichotomocladium elegans]|nr:hypothetical protein BX666DRAFT_1978573 [Dichotomocladium elegans]
MTNARINDDQKMYYRPAKAHESNGVKVSYDEIEFILDYLEENHDDLAIWLNKSVSKRGPGASIPQGGSARLSKRERWEAGKKAGDRVLATWRQMLKQYQKVRITISGTGFGIGPDDHARGIKSIELYKEHYCCVCNRLDAILGSKEAIQQPAAMDVGVYHSIPITHSLSPYKPCNIDIL